MSMPSGWSNAIQLSEDLMPSLYRGGIMSFNSGGLLFGLDNELNHLRAYNECAPLKAIVSKRAKAFNIGIIDVYNSNTGKPALGAEAKAYRQILKKPNALQTQKQFFAQHNTYIDIFGYCPIFIVRPYGVNDSVSAIWNIPPWLFDIEYTGNWLQQSEISGIFKGYKLSWTSGSIPLLHDNLKLIFDDGFGTDMDINLCIPDSRLRSLEYPVTNIIAAYKARNSLITKRGAVGILSNGGKDIVGNIPILPSEKESIQKDFARYGIVGQDWQVIITDANLQWQQMGFPTKDLMLFEEIQDDIDRICDAFGWPSELVSRKDGVTFDNKEKAEKMMYTATIIPEAESRLEQFSNAVIGQGGNLIYNISYTHAPALQAEKLQLAQARKETDTACEKEFKNNLITLNMWLQALSLEPRADEFGDKYYNDLIMLGWQFGNTSITGGDTMPTTPNQPVIN